MRHKNPSSLIVLTLVAAVLAFGQTALAAEQKVEFSVPGVT